MDIVRCMVPLASASGPAIIGVVAVAAGLFLAWLVRTETGDDPPEGDTPPGADTGNDPSEDQPPGAEQSGHPTVTSQPSE